jgi:signal transduction histidine kinase
VEIALYPPQLACLSGDRGGASLEAGSGLAGLRDRVAALDGTLVVTSPAGGPTVVRAEIPCAS